MDNYRQAFRETCLAGHLDTAKRFHRKHHGDLTELVKQVSDPSVAEWLNTLIRNQSSSQPSSTDVQPSSTDVQPSSTDVQPSSTDVQPSSTDVQPSTSDVQPSSTDVQPSSTDVQTIKVKLLDPHAKAPTYGSEFAAGLDVYACGTAIVPPHGRALVSTGIAVSWPYEAQCYMRVAPRSGLSVKHSVDIGAGVIDWDYRGEIKVCVINHGDNEFVVSHGDRIAQLVMTRMERMSVSVVDQLDPSCRGDGGFGSTGV